MNDEITFGFPEREKKQRIDPSWLKEQLQAGASVAQIARESGYSRQTIYDNIKKYKLKIQKRTDLTPKWLEEQKRNGRSDADIGKELGIAGSSVTELRKKHGVLSCREYKTMHWDKVKIDPTWLAEQKRLGRSDGEIAEEVGCSPLTVLKKRKQLGIGQNYHRQLRHQCRHRAVPIPIRSTEKRVHGRSCCHCHR